MLAGRRVKTDIGGMGTGMVGAMMEIEAYVSPRVVESVFRNTHRPNTDAADGWALSRLEEAGDAFAGWARVSLSREDVMGTVLVYHCRGDGDPVVPREGATVREVVDGLDGEGMSELAAEHPRCHDRIERLMREPFSPVFLADGPLEETSAEQYGWLECGEDCLVHLDGLHRLLAWTLDGRFDEGYENDLTAYVAVEDRCMAP